MPVSKVKPINYHGFNRKKLKSIIEKAKIAKNGLEFEESVYPIAKHVLENCEGITNVEKGPDFQGTPFDLFGFKDGKPYIIELKSSMKYFNLPGVVQRERMLAIQNKIPTLKIALLQIRLINSHYRILYNKELRKLLEKQRKKAPIEPIIQWIKKRLE
jgi:hypothetical protein